MIAQHQAMGENHAQTQAQVLEVSYATCPTDTSILVPHAPDISEQFQKFRKLGDAFMFEEVAQIWWRSVVEPYKTIGEGVSWETFKNQFIGRFASEHVTTQKQIEFEQLRQGDMTVVEYIHYLEVVLIR